MPLVLASLFGGLLLGSPGSLVPVPLSAWPDPVSRLLLPHQASDDLCSVRGKMSSLPLHTHSVPCAPRDPRLLCAPLNGDLSLGTWWLLRSVEAPGCLRPVESEGPQEAGAVAISAQGPGQSS